MSVGLDAFLAELARAADAEEARIRAAADARVASVLDAGRAAIERRREAELARLTAVEQGHVNRAIAGVERSTRVAVLEARARLMATILARAEAELVRADGPRYIATVPALVEATLPYLEGRPSVLRCRPDVACVVQGACPRESGIEVVVSPDHDAGVLGETRDGDLLVDNRLVSLLARRREDLAIKLAQQLEAS